MPSKIQLDENLWFLYVCLQNSDYKSIDFNGVGDVTKLKPPAARMRYTRLRRAIESGTLIGTHGTPFQGGADKTAEARKKRKKISGDSDEEGASVDRTPTSGRLALESGSYKSVSDFDEMAQEIESDSVPSAKKQRRASKTPSEAIKSETIGPDAFHFGMNQAVISKNEHLSTDVCAMERPRSHSTLMSKPQKQPFSLDPFVSGSRSAPDTP